MASSIQERVIMAHIFYSNYISARINQILNPINVGLKKKILNSLHPFWAIGPSWNQDCPDTKGSDFPRLTEKY